MKLKTLSILIACLLIFSTSAFAKKNPSGEVIGDTIFHDLKYDYDMQISEGWKVAKIKKDKDIYRMACRKISPTMPVKYNDNPGYFTPPILTVLVDTNMVGVDSLEVLIRAQEGKIAIVKEALKNFKLVSFTQNRPDFNRHMKDKAGDLEGYCIQGRKLMGDADYIRGMIYILQNDKYTFLIEAVAEMERFGFNEKDFSNMVKSIVFRADKPEPKKNEEE